MWLLIVEALLALGLLVFIVWWTMSARRRGEPPAAGDAADGTAAKARGHADDRP
jgi:hypothetical protein